MISKTFIAVFSILMLPAIAFAVSSDKFVTARPLVDQAGETNEIIVPIEVHNTQDLVALDIPLGFSEGAHLQKVEFTDLVSDFEFKVGNIENEHNRVVIGLVTMGKKSKPDLAAGSGVIANLHFILEPGVDAVEICPVELKKPDHTLSYYYNDFSPGYPEVKVIYPEFEKTEYSLSSQSGSIPDHYALEQNSPNPFNPITDIRYSLPEAGHVKLTVFNVLGQSVRELADKYTEAGIHSVVWDGRDNNNASVASGIYFYRLDTDAFSQTRKMLLLK